MDYSAFVDGEKTLLIAPAGYGKTHTIVECLEHTTGCQLILTHTHAGVASLKEKIKNANIATNRYSVETISSFAQKYVNSFYTGADIPDQEDSKNYHPFIIRKAKVIFESKIVKKILQATYSGLFIDEYQDCTKIQHEMILTLAKSIKTHILGDPMQGIFNFNGDLVDFDTDLLEFTRFPDLSIPYRWYQEDNNKVLGDMFIEIRKLLEERKDVDLSSKKINGLYFIIVDSGDIRNSASYYRKCLDKLISNPENNTDFNNLLIIVPEYKEVRADGKIVPRGDINHRVKIRAQIDYKKSLSLIEAIDDKSFYTLARDIDTICASIQREKTPINKIKKNVLEKIFNKTEINTWFNENDIRNKKAVDEKFKANIVKDKLSLFLSQPIPSNMKSIILDLKNILKIKYNRDELIYAILNALTHSDLEGISVYEAMKNQRNYYRHAGRKINGKCIGTTLLTKGLEFDTVAILDADKFDNPKHLYVALTRCCKKLIIFSSKNILSPYS